MKKRSNKKEFSGNPDKVIKLLEDAKFFGRMNDPTSSSRVRGPCGDEMEFYLVIEGDRLTDISFYTEGCDATRNCGEAASRMAFGKTVQEALAISAGDVIETLKDIPADHLHCSILAVSALYRALADYLLEY